MKKSTIFFTCVGALFLMLNLTSCQSQYRRITVDTNSYDETCISLYNDGTFIKSMLLEAFNLSEASNRFKKWNVNHSQRHSGTHPDDNCASHTDRYVENIFNAETINYTNIQIKKAIFKNEEIKRNAKIEENKEDVTITINGDFSNITLVLDKPSAVSSDNQYEMNLVYQGKPVKTIDEDQSSSRVKSGSYNLSSVNNAQHVVTTLATNLENLLRRYENISKRDIVVFFYGGTDSVPIRNRGIPYNGEWGKIYEKDVLNLYTATYRTYHLDSGFVIKENHELAFLRAYAAVALSKVKSIGTLYKIVTVVDENKSSSIVAEAKKRTFGVRYLVKGINIPK